MNFFDWIGGGPPEIGRRGEFGHQTGQVGGAVSQQEEDGIELSDDIQRSDEQEQFHHQRHRQHRTPRIAFVSSPQYRLQQ